MADSNKSKPDDQTLVPPDTGILDLGPQAKPPRRSLMIASLVVFVGLVIVTSFIAFGSSNNSSSPQKQQAATTPAVSNLPPAAVTITDQGFVPASIAVEPGQTVVWTNQSSSSHFLLTNDPKPTQANEPVLNSQQDLTSRDIFAFTFDKAGSYGYHDKNSNLQGTVIVR